MRGEQQNASLRINSEWGEKFKPMILAQRLDLGVISRQGCRFGLSIGRNTAMATNALNVIFPITIKTSKQKAESSFFPEWSFLCFDTLKTKYLFQCRAIMQPQ